MSAVPNRYYNSPWIAQAGENLAAALAPPDPEKTLNAQREKWKFDRLQELSRIEDENRQKHEAGLQSLGDLLSGAGAQPAAPTSPGEAAYFSANPGAAGPAGMDDATFQGNISTALSGGIPFSDIVTAAGPRGSAYLGKQGLLDDKQQASLQLALQRGDDAMARAILGQNGSNYRAGMADDRYRDLAADNDQLRRDLATLRGEQQATHDANVTARGPGGGAPLDISPTDDMNLGYAVDDWAEKFKVKLPPDEWRAFKNRAAQVYQSTRNSTTAVEQAGREIYGDRPEVTPAQDPWGWGDEDDYPAHLNLRDGMGLGDILKGLSTPGAPVAAPAPAAAPVAGAAPPPLLAAPPQRVLVRTPEDARRLPPGTPFITPDGRKGST